MYDELQSMAVLTPLQRNYVLTMACDPFGTPSEWARAAGYKDSVSGNVRVQGHHLSHNPRIQAAIQEVSRAMLHTEGPLLAAAGLLQIARDKNHPKRLRALETIANRVGLHETTEHTVRVEHTDLTGDALLERIRVLAAKLGVDDAKLIGTNVSRETKVIEHGIQDGIVQRQGQLEHDERVPQGRDDSSGASSEGSD